MFSGRFDGGPKEELIRSTQELVEQRGLPTLIVKAVPGDGFGDATMRCLDTMEMMAAFASRNYGEKTASKYCTYYELKYAYDNDIPIIPLKLSDGPWPPEPISKKTGEPDDFGRRQNKFVFHQVRCCVQNPRAKAMPCTQPTRAKLTKRAL